MQGYLSGVIKSFNPNRYYGFITHHDSGEDIFFGCESLPPVFQLNDSNLDIQGQEVYFQLGANPKNGKKQGINIMSAEAENVEDDQYLVKGFIKSWQEGSGFGFLRVEGIETDIYFARDRLPTSLRWVKMLEGTEVKFEIREMDDGKFQAHHIQVLMEVKPHYMEETKKGVKRELPLNAEENPVKRQRTESSNFPKPTSIMARFRGHVKSFGTKSGYGFIMCDDVEGDVVFFDNDCERGVAYSEALEPGSEVQFNLITSKQGKPQAVQVGRTRDPVCQNNALIKPQTFASKPSTIQKKFGKTGIQDIKALCDNLSAQELTNIAAHVSSSLEQKLS